MHRVNLYIYVYMYIYTYPNEESPYGNLPVEDHAVLIIKRQVSTEQSEQQHSHTPHISLEVAQHTALSQLCATVGISQLSCTESCPSEYDQDPMKRQNCATGR